MRYILRRPRAFRVSVCNLVGLAFSLVGVVLLLLFALPPEVPGTGTVLTADNSDEAKLKAETRRFTRNAHIGLALVVVGTALEAVPPFFTAIGSWRRRPPIAATSRSTGERSTMWAPPHLEGATPVSTNWLSVVTAIGAVIISGISIYLGLIPHGLGRLVHVHHPLEVRHGADCCVQTLERLTSPGNGGSLTQC
jgi:hypothetical protein